MTKAEWERLYNGFETRSLLEAVDAIDEIRSQLGNDEDGGPPELRTDLLRLHDRAMSVVNDGSLSGSEAMFDLAEELDAQVFELTTALEKVEATLSLLLGFRPEFVDDMTDDDE